MITTEFTRQFGVPHPILCGGMTGYGTASLIGAVANSGALGFLTALTQPTPEDLVKEIARTRDLTDEPFGVNLTILPTIEPVPYDEYRAAIIEADIRVVETAGSSPAPHLPDFKAVGVGVIHKATRVRHALSAEAKGVDAISIDGFECAGHPGEDVPGLILIPGWSQGAGHPGHRIGRHRHRRRPRRRTRPRGVRAVNMGTRFIATDEAPVHDNVKRQVVANSERDTQLIFRSFHNTARVAKYSVSEQIAEIGARAGATFADVVDLASGARGRERVLADGDVRGGVWWAGQTQGLIDEVASCREVIDTIPAEAEQIIGARLPSYLS